MLLNSSASDGHMGVSSPENRKKFYKKIGINEKNVADIIVSHSDKIKIASKKDGGKYFDGYDAIITDDNSLVLALTVADCMPISVFDPVQNKVALVHCGWKNLVKGLIAKVVKKMSGDPTNFIVYIGPHICQKHYEIRSDVSAKFKGYDAIKKDGKKEFLDIGEVARKQFLKAGIDNGNMKVDNKCTFENKNFFSYRRGDLKSRNLYLLTLRR